MRNIRPLSSKVFLFTAVLMIFLTGCVSQKQIRYLQQSSKEDSVLLWQLKQAAEYRVHADDNLYITIKSLSEKANDLFNQQGSSNQMTSDASIYLNSYTVSREGNIDFPVIGKVYVQDLTVDQVKAKLQQLVSDYLKETIVIVKLVNFNITLLGEFQRPGEYKVYQDKITIFEGLALAGDFTDFANRKQVALIRVTEKGSEIHYLNLNSASILSSPYYYLKPNDVVYAAPLKVKQWGFATFPYAVIFAAISTLILLLTYFKIL
jgi:polysaccharide export outer membrane protein